MSVTDHVLLVIAVLTVKYVVDWIDLGQNTVLI
jgi:hypothetical protein